MENISKAILALFANTQGDDILRALGYLIGSMDDVTPVQHMDTELWESRLVCELLKVDSMSNIDQVTMLGQIVQNKWMMPSDDCTNLKFHSSDSVYNILLHFTAICLLVRDGDPLCRYRSLLRWHTLTTRVGEDLLTTAFLAARDLQWGFERKSYDWKAFIDHDAKEINQLFKKPMAELHMHLKGSSYNFDLSWQCMMNNIGVMQDNFKGKHALRQYRKHDDHLYEKMKRAAAIRYYLAGIVGCIPVDLTSADLGKLIHDNPQDYRMKEFANAQPEEAGMIKANWRSLQDRIDKRLLLTRTSIKAKYSKLDKGEGYENDLQDNDILDYIPVAHYRKEKIENKVLASERRFMYSVFRFIYQDDGDEHKDIATLFYAYLSYKCYFRNIELQLNNRVGFANFASYEEQKTDYLLPAYNRLLYKAAIEGFLEKETEDGARQIECRIVPKEMEESIIDSLHEITREINPIYAKQYSFIFHFIKQRDERKEGNEYRHYQLRQKVKRQAFAIYDFRFNQNNWGKDNLVGKVVGIDAANSEIYCRPEVFAQAFRFLRDHGIEGTDVDNSPAKLDITYHVGEDYMDISDGLRAIDEAIIFLNLHNGDRIGHGLALGTDVRKYYEHRYNAICASKQVLLDDFAWLHHMCIQLLGYTPLCGWLEYEFQNYFSNIFREHDDEGNNMIATFFKNDDDDKGLSCSIEDYYLSWLIRGNSPIIGMELDQQNLATYSSKEREWAYAGINHHPQALNALKNSNARELFDAYHSPKYAERGNKADIVNIPHRYREDYYQLLEHIQQYLLNKIEKKHIAIECNPSSNYKIGEMERYDQHPIVRFFNYGLHTPYPRHDISVSINTDDQGVFSTSLEREYSLIALALERNNTKEFSNSPREIVEWLDKVRDMSVEQKFE